MDEIRIELDKRFDIIKRYANNILDLQIKIKEKEIENLLLKKQINELESKLAPRHSSIYETK